ncbi:MAG: helix-turn-helix transcriptional regulator [Phycisphaerae bacterium]
MTTATTQTAEAAPLAVDAATAAKMLSVSLAHFYTLLSGGRIPAGFRLGRRRLWPVAELRDWLAAGAPSAERWAAIKGNRG